MSEAKLMSEPERMLKPKSLAVINLLETALAQITPPDYNTDAGTRITRGRRRISKDETFPCLIIHEGEEDVIKSTGNRLVHNRLAVTVEGWLEADPLNPLDNAHYLLADIKQCLFPLLNQQPGLLLTVDYLGRVIEPPNDGSQYCSVSVLLAMEWTDDLTNPMQ